MISSEESTVFIKRIKKNDIEIVKFNIPDKELDKFLPYIERSIELGVELELLNNFRKKYEYSNEFLNDTPYCIVNYTLDSYNNLIKVMPEPTARRNSMLDGLELIMVSHLDKDPKTQELFEDYGRDD